MTEHHAYLASAIRKNPSLVPEKAGWYRWYASADDLRMLLDSPWLKETDDEDIKFYENLFLPSLKEDAKKKFKIIPVSGEGDYYGIYVGQSENLWQRIAVDHIKGGGDSQVRSFVFCLAVDGGIEGAENINKEINKYVDRLVVRYETIEDTSKLDEKEHSKINASITPMNIDGNDNRKIYPELDAFLTKLSGLYAKYCN